MPFFNEDDYVYHNASYERSNDNRTMSRKEQIDKLESKGERLQDILKGVLMLLGHTGYTANTIQNDDLILNDLKEQLNDLYDQDED